MLGCGLVNDCGARQGIPWPRGRSGACSLALVASDIGTRGGHFPLVVGVGMAQPDPVSRTRYPPASPVVANEGWDLYQKE